MPLLSLGQCQTNPRPSAHAEHIQPQHAGPPPTSLHAPLPQCTPRHAHSLSDQHISPVVLAAGGRQLGNIMHHLKSRLRKSRSTKDRRNTRATQDIALPVARRSTARLSSFPSVQRSELPTPPAFSPAARWAEQCLAADAVTVICWDCMAGHDRLPRWLRSDGRPANCSRSCLRSWLSNLKLYFQVGSSCCMPSLAMHCKVDTHRETGARYYRLVRHDAPRPMLLTSSATEQHPM